MSAKPRLFCFGLGYTAQTLAARKRDAGWTVVGTCRSPGKQAALAARGFETMLFDRNRPIRDAQEILAGTTHILISAPPDEAGDPVLGAHRADLLALETLEWVGYLSTTGVYGDRAGGWVDETTPISSEAARNRLRAEAEGAWLALAREYGMPVHAFRLAGIYGPGRNQLVALREGRARRIIKKGQVFGRIHVDDIATVLEASMAKPNPGAIYNVVDNEPEDSATVIEHAATLLGIAPPPLEPYETVEMSPMARSFYEECRRVRNDRIKRELGVTLRYPTYREGLAALLATMV